MDVFIDIRRIFLTTNHRANDATDAAFWTHHGVFALRHQVFVTLYHGARNIKVNIFALNNFVTLTKPIILLAIDGKH